MRLLLLTLCMVTTPSQPASAQCEGRLEGASNAGGGEYDPFDATDFRRRHSATIRNTGNEQCDFVVAFERLPSNGTLAPGLHYRIEDAAGRSLLTDKSPSQTEAQFLIFSNVAALQTASADFYLVMPRGQFALPSTYHDGDVVMKLYLRTRSGMISQQPQDEKPLPVSQTVKASVHINIAGGGLYTTLNFNTLSKGKERTVAIRTQSNQRYKLTLRSQNGGAMRLDPDIPGEQWEIPYSLKVNAVPVTLDTSATLQRSTASAAAGQENHALTFRIEEVEDRRAGFYRDVVTIEVAPE